MSKAALIRQAVAREFKTVGPDAANPWAEMAGWLDLGGVEDIDEAIYGPAR